MNNTDTEIWKDIKNYEGLYQVSSLGRVKSFKKSSEGIILKPYNHKDFYAEINLIKNGIKKHVRIHRLVAETFISNPKNKETVNHINEDKTDNRVSNLEWATYTENNNHGTSNARMAKTKGKRVHCVELNMTFNSASEASKFVGRSKGKVSCAITGKHRCAGYNWFYIN